MKDELKEYSFLSGSTLYMMMLESKNTRANDGHKIANYELLIELEKIVNDKAKIRLDKKELTEQASKYKSGMVPVPRGFFFNTEKNVSLFDERYRQDYGSLLNRFRRFADEYLFIDKDDPWLIKALFDIVENDTTIDADEVLFLYDGKTEIKKRDLHEVKEIDSSSILLGLWCYTLHQKIDLNKNKGAYQKFTHRLHNNQKTVDRSLFDWNEEISIITPHIANEETIDEQSSSKKDQDREDSEKSSGKRMPEDKFSKYLAKSYEKFSTTITYIYRTERPFRDFYVCNNVMNRSRVTVRQSEGREGYLYNDSSIKNLDMMKFDGPRNIILGQGGLGKSMMMNHLFLSTIDLYSEKSVIPIFISLGDYIPGERTLLSLICESMARFDTDLTSEDVLRRLKDGHMLLLMDGLDEVKKESLNECIRELDVIGDSYDGNNVFVVSSREMPDVARLKGYRAYELMPLNEKQAIEMVQKIEPDVIPEITKRNFINDIKNKRFRFDEKEKKEYLGNPLFLTLMLLTYSQTNSISTERYLFYEDAYKAMATLHDGRKGVTRAFFTGLSEREFQRYFGQFCIESYFDNKLRFSRRQMDAYFQKVIDDNGLDTSVDMFFRDVTEKLCLMYLDGNEYRFIHRSFQEYFAAYFITNLLDDDYREVFDELLRIDSRIVSDNTIAMLYGLNSRKFERFIVIPFLEEFDCDADDDENYRHFLRWLYSSVEYATGELNSDFADNHVHSAIYKFITENYGFKEDIDASDFDDDESYADESELYYYVEDNRTPSEHGPDCQYVEKSGLWKYKDPNGEINDERIEYHEAGYVCRIDIDNVVRKEFNNGLWELFNDSTFPLKVEFESAQDLLKELKGKYSDNKKQKFGLGLSD